ncbi:hypothetical protein KTO63_12955 [Parasegetibacter sp. MAH-26]|uniref:Uncharacterized protein n=1 Tax=Pinibacter aurantiacus TaxID=2851599 RepID=A0A9E2W872_9BACT|nr:hypothetical protein [Pinibacter aurantiacus]
MLQKYLRIVNKLLTGVIDSLTKNEQIVTSCYANVNKKPDGASIGRFRRFLLRDILQIQLIINNE